MVASFPSNEALAARLSLAVQTVVDRSPAAIVADPKAPELAEAERMLAGRDEEGAEVLVRAYLKATRDDHDALILLADIATRCELFPEAERILMRTRALYPESVEACVNLAKTLQRDGNIANSLTLLDEALQLDPVDEIALSFKAAVLNQVRDLSEAEQVFQTLLAAHPTRARSWMNYAYLLKTIGRIGDSISAYRVASALDPSMGRVWWGLANLKVATFHAADREVMEKALQAPATDPRDRIELHFAFAKALDMDAQYDRAFAQLQVANSLRKAQHPYRHETVTEDVDRSIALLDRDFFAKRSAWGHAAKDPIFIVGMHRSGSTLVEQILASHPSVEGTEELFHVRKIVGSMERPAQGRRFPEGLEEINRSQVDTFARRYLSDTSAVRRTEQPRFTDKMPGNWAYIGLILLMFPNANIIDIRRNAMDCCFANYGQQFHWGVDFAYDLKDLGSYYKDYVRLMDHFDRILPGRIYHIKYEDMIENLEAETTGLLEYLNLPFDPRCLAFHETDRAVHTPSSGQVRRPINRDGIGRWKPYDQWLEPLKLALGDLVHRSGQ